MFFSQFHDEAEEYLKIGFEPNPQFNRFYEKESPYAILQEVHLHNAAVWTHNGKAPLYLSDVSGQLGSTLVQGKTTGHVNYNNPLEVPTIDFSDWIAKTVQNGDEVLVKMNIEGAEYAVLEKMIEDHTIGMIDELYIEFHGAKIKGRSQEADEAFKKKLEGYGVEVIPWAIKGDGFKNILRHWLCGSKEKSTQG